MRITKRNRNLDREFGRNKTTASDLNSELKNSENLSREELTKQEQIRRLEYAKQLMQGSNGLSDRSSSLDEEEPGGHQEGEDIDPHVMQMMYERFNRYK